MGLIMTRTIDLPDLVSGPCTCFLLVNAFEDKAGVLGGVSQWEDILVNLFECFLIDNAVGAFLMSKRIRQREKLASTQMSNKKMSTPNSVSKTRQRK